MISPESNIHSCSDTCELKECVEARAKRHPTLEFWRIVNYGTLAVAEGFVYGSDKFQDGEYIHTSWLRAYSLSKRKVTTRNRVYLLGKPAVPPPADHEVIIPAHKREVCSSDLET